MPPRKHKETPEEQAERFRRAVQDMVNAGELNPTEADARFERAMMGVARLRQDWFSGEEGSGTPPSEP